MLNIIRHLSKFNIKQTLPFMRALCSNSDSSQQGAKALITGIYEKARHNGDDRFELSDGACQIDRTSDGRLTKAMTGLHEHVSDLGKVTLLLDMCEEYPVIAVAGLGQRDVDFDPVEYLDERAENIRIATGAAARELHNIGVNEVVVEDFGRPDAAAEGACLGVWHYSDNAALTKLTRLKLDKGGDDKDCEDDWMRGITKAEAQNLARCFCETPPNHLTPTQFAQRARDLLCPLGVQVFGRDVRWMKEHNMTALLTAGSSSVEVPVFLSLNYCSDDPDTSPYVMIGQGTTFNTGGLCDTECSRMTECSFASAATILGVFKSVAMMRLPINLRGYIPLYENMLSSLSLKCMDVIETHGFLIQTPHTNNVHQVTLAEALLHAYKAHHPCQAFTIGTLSPGSRACLGGVSTVFARCDQTWDHVNYAGAVTGDRMWRMPLFSNFRRRVTENNSVDVYNMGKNECGEPCLVAAVLNKLAPECLDFTYIDITGSSAIANGYVPYLAEGLATGAPTRGLIQLLCHLDYCKKQVAAASSVTQ